jgi:undecaprenyl diphosphate synthase
MGGARNTSPTPRHIAIILDGNGRWASRRGLPRKEGHRRGAQRVREIVRACKARGVEYLTLYAFSTENWKRPADEVDAIMNLLRRYLEEAEQYRGENIRAKFLGDRTALAPDLAAAMTRVEEESAACTGMTLNIAINYGGREELTHAVRALAQKAAAGEIDPSAITEADVADALYTAGQPDPDLIIRPSGEERLSNFLLWQCAYAEFVFQDVLWPDFSEEDLDRAIEIYGSRGRRFGGI